MFDKVYPGNLVLNKCCLKQVLENIIKDITEVTLNTSFVHPKFLGLKKFNQEKGYSSVLLHQARFMKRWTSPRVFFTKRRTFKIPIVKTADVKDKFWTSSLIEHT